MRDNGVDAVGEVVQRALFVAGIAFGQSAAHKGIFGIGDGALDVLMLGFDIHLVAACAVGLDQAASAALPKLLANPVAHLQHAAVGVALGGILLQLLVVLQKLDCQEARRQRIAETVLIQFGAELFDAALQLTAVVDVDVARFDVAPLENLYYLVKQVVNAVAAASRGGDDGHTQQGRQLVDVQTVAASLQLVVHIEGHHHRDVHIYQLGGEVQVAFQVAAVHDVKNYIGTFLNDVLPHIEFLWRIGAERIGAWQVDQVERVSAVLEGAHLLVDRHATVVAHPFVGVGSDIENTGFAAVRVADQGYIDRMRTFGGDVLHCRVAFDLDAAVVVVVHNLALGLLLAHYFHLFGIAAAQRHLKVHYAVLDRVVQRRVEDGLDGHPVDETHLDDALAEGAVTRHANHHTTHTRL